MSRRLAAVLAADVVGYSKMMGEDADGTLTSLRRLRTEVFGPSVAGHRGTLIKSMGDGWIVTFDSAVDAVTCAMRLQDKMSAEPQIKLRVGIHIGDITQEDEDVFGDGVNIAARLEAMTQPGGVTISDAVFGTLDGTLRPAFDDTGEQTLKNIARPIRVWSRGGATLAARSAPAQKDSGFPKLHIKPVEMAGSENALRQMADALTNDLEAYFASMMYLKTSVTLSPGPTAYVLHSNLRSSGDALRLELRLVKPDGSVLWRRKYDGSMADAFEWQDETSVDAASRVRAAIIEFCHDQILQKPQSAFTGADWLLMATRRFSAGRKGMHSLLDYVQNAIKAEPDLSEAYASGLSAFAAASSFGYTDVTSRFEPMLGEWLEKANALSTGGVDSKAITAIFRYVQSGDIAAARSDVASILRDLPFNAEALLFTGYLCNFLGEPQDALDCLRKFKEVARHHHFVASAENGLGGACVMLGRYDQALRHLASALQADPDYIAAYRWKTAALAQLGRLDEARAVLAEHDTRLPDQTIALVQNGSRYVDNDATQRYFEGLRLAGMAA